jgi:hypothetical protein
MGRVDNGCGSSALCMWYVVTGQVPARIEVGPGDCPEIKHHPDLSSV